MRRGPGEAEKKKLKTAKMGRGPGEAEKKKLKDGEFQSTTPPLNRQVDTAAPYPLSLGGGECGRAANSSGWGSRRVPDPGGTQTWRRPGGGMEVDGSMVPFSVCRPVCRPQSSPVQQVSAGGLAPLCWLAELPAGAGGGGGAAAGAGGAALLLLRGGGGTAVGGGEGARPPLWSDLGPPRICAGELRARGAAPRCPRPPSAGASAFTPSQGAARLARGGPGLDSPARSRSTFRHRAAGCCREFRLPLALNTCVILKLVQYTLWKEGWMTELGWDVAVEQDDPFYPVHGIDMQEGIRAECLEYKFSTEMMQLVGLDIQPCVKKLWKMQKPVGAFQWVRGALGIPSRLMKPLYGQLKGSDPKEPQNPSSKMIAAWQKILQSCMDTAQGLEMAQLAQLVEHETLDLRMVVWQDSNRSSQAAVFINRMVSVQMLEVMAVTVAVHLWRMIPSNIVADSIFAAKQLARMDWEDFPSSEAAGILDETLASHTAPVASLYVCGHSEVPSLFTRGNAIADTVASTPVFGLGSLQIWQTGVIWESCLSPRQGLAVAMSASSVVIMATEHVGSGLTAVRYHLATAVAMVGLPSHVETDNGSCFTSHFTQEWLVKTDYGKWDKSSFLTGAVGGESKSGT
ncbi:uncharacterized protein [Excalfactoria chinensis]|uniref:uncharacterized protein n=1 Tax=Excalfactoria chinensis TaxID=46218 RepID=UPI003B3A11B7